MNMPINAIKKILKEEVELKISNILFLEDHQKSIDGLYHLIGREFLNGITRNVMQEFNAIQSEEGANIFISKYYGMNLEEWVDSL